MRKRLWMMLLLLGLFIIPAQAQQNTIAQLLIDSASAQEEPEFRIFLALLSRADGTIFALLDDPTANITVFAPTDDALVAYIESLGMSYQAFVSDQALISNLLLAHVIQDQVVYADLSALTDVPTLLEGQSLTIETRSRGVFVNNSEIVVENITADNGIIHAIGTVITSQTSP